MPKRKSKTKFGFRTESKLVQIERRNTKILERLPLPKEILPDWILFRKRFIEEFINKAKILLEEEDSKYKP